VGKDLLIVGALRSHSDTTHWVGLLWTVISPMQRNVHDNTQLCSETDVRSLGGIRTHNLSKRAAADVRLTQRDNGDRLLHSMTFIKSTQYCTSGIIKSTGTTLPVPFISLVIHDFSLSHKLKGTGSYLIC
jgi:hypothetical protein